jgi:hypothetical protein
VGYGLSFVPQNQQEDEDRMGHALRSSGLLHLEASSARVCQFCLKIGEGMTVGSARGIIVEVMWK